MKFGKQLELGIYAPWKDHYIQYNKLKRIIQRRRFVFDQRAEEQLKQSNKAAADAAVFTSRGVQMSDMQTMNASECTPLSSSSATTAAGVGEKQSGGTYAAASQADEGSKVSGSVTAESIEFFPVIVEEIEKINKFYVGKLADLRLALDAINSSRTNVYLTHHTRGTDPSFLLKLRDIYVELAALRSYCELSKTGFYKIIKKYDKIMGETTLSTWMRTIERQQFSITTEPVQLMDVVTSLVSRDKLLEWERFATEQQNKTNDDIFPQVRFYGLAISLTVFAVSLSVPSITPDDPCASRCMALLLLTVSLWVTEAIPYFATALLIPVFVTLFGVLKESKDAIGPMTADLAAEFVLNHIFNHTTMLLIGGYTISTAFSRCQLELRVAAWMQQAFGSHPPVFILAVMFLGLFLSMWISNHTAPILCATIILPIVRDLPTDSRFSKALLLGLAYACNFGGMMTPISSLQNVLAVQYLQQSGIEVSFGRWLCFSLPFCVVSTLLGWLWILLIVQPYDIDSIPIIVYERSSNVLGKRNITVLVLSLLTIFIFATFNSFKDIFGDIGIVALIFVSVMFGSGILTDVDFNSLSWHTLFLVGGGNVLGKAVTSSGLLEYLSDGIIKALPFSHPWLALFFILIFCLTTATFVSHTVASLILMPIISTIGITLEMPEEAVMGSALAVSAAMALPFSSFPNVNSLLIVDDFQRPYLSVKDFVITGLPLSLFSVLLIATFGFLLIRVIVVGVQS